MKFRVGQILERMESDGKEVVFRILKKDDLEGCLRHINTLVRERAYILKQKPVTLKTERKWLKDAIAMIKKGTKITVVITVDRKIAGLAHIERMPMDANRHVVSIGIGLSSHRGLGIGTRLMLVLEKIARKHFRAKVMKLTCCECNTPAMNLYKKVGFKEVGKIPKGFGYYGKYLDEVIFVKELK